MAGASTTQFMNQKLQEETPIFSKTRVDFTPTHPLTHLVVSNSHIVMALANRTLIRIDQEAPGGSKQEELDLSKTIQGAKISNLFLDPSGHHLLISLKSSEAEAGPSLYYLHTKWQQPKPCNKFKGTLVSAVGWAQGQVGASTGPLLAGTTLGLIIEAELTSDERFFSMGGVEEHFRQVFDIGKGQHTPVTGLQYHSVPSTGKYFVLATTPTRLYQFQGYVSSSSERPLLQQVFSNYLHVPERFLELPSSLKTSTLSFHWASPSSNGLAREAKLPDQFGWLTESGVYTGRIDPWEGDSDSVTVDCLLISNTGKEVPKTAHITQFHVVQLFPDRIRAVCTLNEQVVFDDEYDGTYGGLVGLSHDQAKNIYWTFTEYAVYRYQVVSESRHVWRIYLEQGQFALATQHCDNDPQALDLILTKQAERLFEEGKYVESAMHFAKTRCSFEEVTLRFMALEDASALKNYLKKKLETLKNSEKTQMTLIVLWLIEIYQNRLGRLREGKDGEDGAEYRNLQEEFLALLRQPRVEECMKNNKDTVYSLLGSHGDQRNLVYIAQALRDTDRLVQYNLRNKQFSAVLTILTQEADPELFYTYCPTLMNEIPQKTVDTLISLGRQLSAERLLPCLLCPSKEGGLESIRYLEHLISALNCRLTPVHNLLVSLYIAWSPSSLLPYLESPIRACSTEYALKLCVEAGDEMAREAVTLYTLLNQHEAAVELALKIDTDLAASCAAGKMARQPLPEETSKKLWLKVARHVVQEKNDIKLAMEFLKECPSVKIEDILPFFPDFVTIDHFKAAICDSLQQYTDHIDQLKKDMIEASGSARVIREEIAEARNQHQFVRATDRCSICGGVLISKPFYLFSCKHKFHSSCLAETVMPHLSAPRQRRLAELQHQLANFTKGEGGSLDSKTALPSRAEQAQGELDDLIASECVFCGDLMIRNIDKPFIDDQEFDRVIAEWL